MNSFNATHIDYYIFYEWYNILSYNVDVSDNLG